MMHANYVEAPEFAQSHNCTFNLTNILINYEVTACNDYTTMNQWENGNLIAALII